MREFNLLADYPVPNKPRYVGSNLRTIKNRIVASYRDKNLYDGSRDNGYGGYKYDGRWVKVAKKICREYGLNDSSKFLHIGCEKGFLLYDLKNLVKDISIFGVEVSEYAVNNCMESVKNNIIQSNYLELKMFEDNYFDFVYAAGVVYSFTISDAIKCLKEINRISKNKSFITLASYTNIEDYWLFKNWTLLGSTILLKKEWRTLLSHTGYEGDYYFTNAETLNLVKEDNV